MQCNNQLPVIKTEFFCDHLFKKKIHFHFDPAYYFFYQSISVRTSCQNNLLKFTRTPEHRSCVKCKGVGGVDIEYCYRITLSDALVVLFV